jgi:hypothetical protein
VDDFWFHWRTAVVYGHATPLRKWFAREIERAEREALGRGARSAGRAKLDVAGVSPDPYVKAMAVQGDSGKVTHYPSQPRQMLWTPHADALDRLYRAFSALTVGGWEGLRALRRCPRCGWFFGTTDLSKRRLCVLCSAEKRRADARARAARRRSTRAGVKRDT